MVPHYKFFKEKWQIHYHLLGERRLGDNKHVSDLSD
jgi:hypothetical protein